MNGPTTWIELVYRGLRAVQSDPQAYFIGLVVVCIAIAIPLRAWGRG